MLCRGCILKSFKATRLVLGPFKHKVFSSVFAPNTKKFGQVADPRNRVATDP